MLYFKLYPFTLLKHLIVSHSYLCIWVNCCSIISQVIIYLKVFKRWISILSLALFCSTLPVTLLVVDLKGKKPPKRSGLGMIKRSFRFWKRYATTKGLVSSIISILRAIWLNSMHLYE